MNIINETAVQITRRATAKALLECASIMYTDNLPFLVARNRLKDNNRYWLQPSGSFSYLRYAGESTMPYATIQHQIDMILLIREHILQTGLLNYLPSEDVIV